MQSDILTSIAGSYLTSRSHRL